MEGATTAGTGGLLDLERHFFARQVLGERQTPGRLIVDSLTGRVARLPGLGACDIGVELLEPELQTDPDRAAPSGGRTGRAAAAG